MHSLTGIYIYFVDALDTVCHAVCMAACAQSPLNTSFSSSLQSMNFVLTKWWNGFLKEKKKVKISNE
jgi:hypothetical protein